jgi:hypothetical protein
MPFRRRFSASLWLSDFWPAVRRGFEEGLLEGDFEETLAPFVDDDRGFLDRFIV